MADEPDAKKLRLDGEDDGGGGDGGNEDGGGGFAVGGSGSEGPDMAPGGMEELEVDDEWIEATVGEEARDALKEADDVQEELHKINEAASEEVLQVEQRYNVKRQPVYAQRGDALAKIPLFWRRALVGHPNLQEFLTEDDIHALAALTRLDVQDAPDIKSGFTITFTFNPQDNHFFSNAVLEKTLKFGEDASLEASATKIDWLEGMAPNAEPPGDKRIRAPEYNFFTSWFLSERYAPGTQDAVAEYIKEDVWPEPVKYWKAGLIQERLPPTSFDEMFEGEEGEEGEDYDEAELPEAELPEAGYDDGFGGPLDEADEEGEDAEDDQGS
ncbi:MAG: hypothetical protein J3K34DRAFT_424649 [Monoraphidium minutum]|nr:MAG: hypothetical protein J3K34DRAFT_424649 [Monoraphidium minutum]